MALIGRRGCTGTGCVLAPEPGDPVPGRRRWRWMPPSAGSGPGAWPLELEGRVAMGGACPPAG